MILSFLLRQRALLHHLLHHGMVFVKLKQLVVAKQINAGISHMHILRRPPRTSAHTTVVPMPLSEGVLPRLFIDAAVGLLHGAFQQCASGLRVCASSIPASMACCSASTAMVLAKRPPRAPPILSHTAPQTASSGRRPPVAVLVFAALAADICFSDKLHAVVPPFASRRSWPQAALMSVPRAAAHGGVDAQLRQERLKTFDVGGIRSGIRRAVHGIDGNKVHVRTHALDELCQPAGRLRAVVHAVHH